MIKVFITQSGGVTCFDILSDEPNGVALTFEELEQRERAAFESARETIPLPAKQYFAGKCNLKFKTFDDYLKQRKES